MLRWAAEAMGSSAVVWDPPPGKSPLKRTEITREPSRRHCRWEAASETAASGHRGQAASARTRIFVPMTEFRQLPAGSRGVPAGDGEPRPAGSSTRPPCAFPGAARAGAAAAGGRREGPPALRWRDSHPAVRQAAASTCKALTRSLKAPRSSGGGRRLDLRHPPRASSPQN